jgi:uncharacterized protein YwgA
MTLLFSDGLNEALIALLVKKFRERTPGFLGRTAIQKLCYFARELGAPLSYTFQIYHYGPFSDRLATDLDFMLADRVLTDESNDRSKYSSYRLGPEAQTLLVKYDYQLKDFERLIESIAASLGKLRPEELEIVSTLHFIFQRLRTARGANPDKQAVIKEFTAHKGDKFDSSRIQTVYDQLVEGRLIE